MSFRENENTSNDYQIEFDYQPDFQAIPQEGRHTYRIPDNSVYLKQIKANVFKKQNPN